MRNLREGAWRKNENQGPASFQEFLHAIATIEKENAVKEGATSAEAYKHLSYDAKLVLYMELKRCFMGLQERPPNEWKQVEYTGLPQARIVETIEDVRWIANIEALQKIYAKCLIPAIKEQTTSTAVMALGFKEGCSTDDVAGIIRGILYKAKR